MPFLEQWQIDHYTAKKVRIEAEIAKLDAALAYFLDGGAQSYTLNTGQTSQQVTRANLPALRAWRSDLDAQLFELLGLLNGSMRSAYFRPGF
jgi:hypothetical protein